MPRYNEFQSCCALATWWAYACRGYKVEERLLMHIPTASATSIKYRANNKRMGVRAGTPDYFLAVPRKDKHGLWVEMKTEDGRLSGEQETALHKLRENGYETAVCYSTDSARNAIESYLKP